MASGPAPDAAPEPEHLGSMIQAQAGDRLRFTPKPKPILEPQVGQIYGVWVEKRGLRTAEGKQAGQVMLLRVTSVIQPDPDDLRSTTLIQAEIKEPRKDWKPLEGPVSASFLVERSAAESDEEVALDQYTYWSRLTNEDLRPAIDIQHSSDPRLQAEIKKVEEQRAALSQRAPIEQVSAGPDGTRARERELDWEQPRLAYLYDYKLDRSL